MTQRNQFIDDAGLSTSSSLTHLLHGHNNDTSDEYEWIRHSPYYSESQFKNIKSGLLILSLNIQNVFTKFDQFSLFIERVNDSNPISVINKCYKCYLLQLLNILHSMVKMNFRQCWQSSENTQSINAKFDEFQFFVMKVKTSHPISVICLQECWLDEKDTDSMNLFNLYRKNLFMKENSTKKNNIIYIHYLQYTEVILLEKQINSSTIAYLLIYSASNILLISVVMAKD